jgi:hypothetical protein
MTAPMPGQPYSGQGYHGSWSAPPAQPGMPPGPYGPGAPYGYPMIPATSTNGMAIASMVLGIVWIYWIGSILAIVFGHISLSQIKRNPYQTRRGMAIAGLVLGYVGLTTLTILIVAIIAVGPSSDAGVDDVREVRYSSS